MTSDRASGSDERRQRQVPRLPWSTHEANDNAASEAEWRERHLMISYPFPCADDMIANLRLPKYLTRDDADRIKQVIDTLVIA